MAPKGPWSSSEVLEVATAESREPAVAMLGETLHLVWNCNQQLYHAWRTADGWSQATPVAIGEQPVLAAAPDGQLHCLFVNQFARNYEIYHVWWDGARWSLPVNVSRTAGASSQPALAVGADGSLHAAWADTTPGYSVVYYGTRDCFSGARARCQAAAAPRRPSQVLPSARSLSRGRIVAAIPATTTSLQRLPR